MPALHTSTYPPTNMSASLSILHALPAYLLTYLPVYPPTYPPLYQLHMLKHISTLDINIRHCPDRPAYLFAQRPLPIVVNTIFVLSAGRTEINKIYNFPTVVRVGLEAHCQNDIISHDPSRHFLKDQIHELCAAIEHTHTLTHTHTDK